MNLGRSQSRRFIDDETALPVQAEGELTDNPNITATATNFMSMASNITFRRVVKNFDDGITTPSIRRLYDWNMQHNSRDDIKGDMKVDARGSSALLQRELQAQMLLNMAQNWCSSPGPQARPQDLRDDHRERPLLDDPADAGAGREGRIRSRRGRRGQRRAGGPARSQQNPAVIAANARLEAAKIDSAAPHSGGRDAARDRIAPDSRSTMTSRSRS